MYAKKLRLAICPVDLKSETPGEISEIINFGCSVLISVCPQLEYSPMFVKAKIIFCVLNE